jgi:hypothetical protein
MSKVKVTWKAYGNKPEIGRSISSVEFEIPPITVTLLTQEVHNKCVCEGIYEGTNLRAGGYWDIIQPLLSETRTHTAISVGDEIEIDGQVYICADFGFEKIEDVEIKKFGESVFSVTVKDSKLLQYRQ